RIKRFNTSPAVNKKVADLRADHVASLGLETGGTLGKIVTGVQDVRLRILSKTLNGVVHFVRRCGFGHARAGAPTSTGMLSMRAGIELEKCEEIECTILGLHLLLTTDSTTCTAASKTKLRCIPVSAI
ncbi:hypothetical protein PF004_g27659, partial [Phytophthora fragariae]